MRSDPCSIDSYDYYLPPHLIASHPANPKDSAKLLVYDRQKDRITHAIFRDILEFLPSNAKIILNDTKVVKARLFGHKESGGKVELLFNSPIGEDRYLVYIRGRVKVSTKLFFGDSLEAKVLVLNRDGSRIVRFYRNGKTVELEELYHILDKIGHIPLPPYIKRENKQEDEKDYQTIFAKQEGAVAAPTASLHFTPTLFQKMQEQYETFFVTLHVGAGTFKPVEVENILDHKMHKEFYSIPLSTKKIIESEKPIVAVGTTVTRTIEYYYQHRELEGEADIFLHPNNPPKRVNHLLTNFHLPKSTLLMLVASFVGIEKMHRLYQEAIDREYRFYSYGDAMLIL